MDEISLMNNVFVDKANASRKSAASNKKKMLESLALAAQPPKISPKDAIISSIAKALPMLIGYAGAQSEGAAMAAKARGASGQAYLDTKRADAQEQQRQASLQAQLAQEDYQRDVETANSLELKGIERGFKESDRAEDRAQEVSDMKYKEEKKDDRNKELSDARRDGPVKSANIIASSKLDEKNIDKAGWIAKTTEKLQNLKTLADQMPKETTQMDALYRYLGGVVDKESTAAEINSRTISILNDIIYEATGKALNKEEMERQTQATMVSPRATIQTTMKILQSRINDEIAAMEGRVTAATNAEYSPRVKAPPRLDMFSEEVSEDEVIAVLNEARGIK